MEFYFIEMPKLIRDWQAGKLDPWNDVLARWLLMLGMIDRRKSKVYEDIFKELEAIAMKDEVLREAFNNWETLSGTLEERIAYEARLKRVLDEEAELRRNEDIELGEKQGIEKTAQQHLLKGMDLEFIKEVTGLSEERIQELK